MTAAFMRLEGYKEIDPLQFAEDRELLELVEKSAFIEDALINMHFVGTGKQVDYTQHPASKNIKRIHNFILEMGGNRCFSEFYKLKDQLIMCKMVVDESRARHSNPPKKKEHKERK